MLNHTSPYGIDTAVPLPYADAVEQVKDALAREGFGIISEIDMAAALRQKLGVHMRPYVILGACLPALAHQALAAEPLAGLLLPCNVVVYDTGHERLTAVAALDPEVALALTGNPALEPLATEVGARLRRALEAVDFDAVPHGQRVEAVEKELDEIC